MRRWRRCSAGRRGALLERGVTARRRWPATDVAQPLLFAIQRRRGRRAGAEGMRPAMLLGHSVGEVAAAWRAGILLDSTQAARLIVAR